MSSQTDMWMEFAKSFGLLFAVLAFFLMSLYLIRRFSGRLGTKGSIELIKVSSVYHLSPKEKLVLVSVLGESILIGVSPGGISSLARFDKSPETPLKPSQTAAGFQNLLKKSLKKSNRTDEMAQDSHSSNFCVDSGKEEAS
ncbi:flagellar biosynthetic protein FliO [uncultured Desulfobacter sp.]|uniref:FliO/MopB family protein n=1 Tax=uncultured Desulfobacter sp. TaxID=240139 RepID=UPI002AAAD8D5|nr:flagellar biosynthetic protein FliO [uncultured Desulfobacter sp.]